MNQINKTNQTNQLNEIFYREEEDSMERRGVMRLIGAAVLWLAMVSPALSDDTFKVAVMNQQTVVEQSKAGKRALEELKAYSMSRQRIINADDLELKELQQATQDEKLSDSVKQEKQSQFQAKLDAYQRRLSDFNREIQQKQRDMVAEYSKKVQAAAQAVVEKNEYVAVIDKGNETVMMRIVLYHQPALDVTDQVVKEFDRQNK
ncbi:MAG: OmpH family outer membrane protein [Nitrospira sp.]|nr:MAG: OmpH family outer membrane protein [Nitrospira sp.]